MEARSPIECFLVPAWQVKECPWLAGELLLILDEECQTRLSGFLLGYSRSTACASPPRTGRGRAVRSGAWGARRLRRTGRGGGSRRCSSPSRAADV
ncbi:hypothetical protein ACF06W_22405 [Streptomyces albus]|uniref:hypothetical protein n=1 Tax=Streptomyces albus TaxID=1888 RepID=UPI0036FD62A9